MRSKRVLIYEDDVLVLEMLEHFFTKLGYDVLKFEEPTLCSIYDEEHLTSCSNLLPCADLMITDYKMPKMNGLQLLLAQAERGCKLNVRNKALMSGHVDDGTIKRIMQMGAAYFEKPCSLSIMSEWVLECENRVDLSQPLGMKRKESRMACSHQIIYSLAAQHETYSGTVVNYSDSGFSMRTYVPLLKTDTVVLASPLPNSCLTASVKWISRSDNGAFVAGLYCY